MKKNIYTIFREYNKIHSSSQKTKYMVSLNTGDKETLKSLLTYANNPDRFENIYDGWINSLAEELVVLEVYSVILNTKFKLQKYCVDDKTYKNFIKNKRSMLLLLLENKQYEQAEIILNVQMSNNTFKEEKLVLLKKEVLNYLILKKMVLPKKLIVEIFKWVDELSIPTYLTTDIDGEFSFPIHYNPMKKVNLELDTKRELTKSKNLPKYIDTLLGLS